jgi:hypothetical protein
MFSRAIVARVGLSTRGAAQHPKQGRAVLLSHSLSRYTCRQSRSKLDAHGWPRLPTLGHECRSFATAVGPGADRESVVRGARATSSDVSTHADDCNGHTLSQVTAVDDCLPTSAQMHVHHHCRDGDSGGRSNFVNSSLTAGHAAWQRCILVTPANPSTLTRAWAARWATSDAASGNSNSNNSNNSNSSSNSSSSSSISSSTPSNGGGEIDQPGASMATKVVAGIDQPGASMATKVVAGIESFERLHGHAHVPATFSVPKSAGADDEPNEWPAELRGYALGSAVAYMRHLGNCDGLPDSTMDALDGVGMVWDVQDWRWRNVVVPSLRRWAATKTRGETSERPPLVAADSITPADSETDGKNSLSSTREAVPLKLSSTDGVSRAVRTDVQDVNMRRYWQLVQRRDPSVPSWVYAEIADIDIDVTSTRTQHDQSSHGRANSSRQRMTRKEYDQVYGGLSVTCECGAEVKRKNLAKHRRSMKHASTMAKLEDKVD